MPLRTLADASETEGLGTINREWGRRVIRVQCSVMGRDIASFVRDAKERIGQQLDLPEGYLVDWGGQFENLERARRRLAILVPLTLGLVFFLLYFSLQSLRDVLLIYTGIPFAAVGGVLGLWHRGISFSVSAAVGLIALPGIAVLNGQILIAAIRTFREEGLAVRDPVTAAARQRLRPVLATAITDAAGFIPMAISTGVGAEVQRPLATVVMGGVLTSTLLTLYMTAAIDPIRDGGDRPQAADAPLLRPTPLDRMVLVLGGADSGPGSRSRDEDMIQPASVPHQAPQPPAMRLRWTHE